MFQFTPEQLLFGCIVIYALGCATVGCLWAFWRVGAPKSTDTKKYGNDKDEFLQRPPGK